MNKGATVLEYTDSAGETIAWATCSKPPLQLSLKEAYGCWKSIVTDKSAKFSGFRIWITARRVKLINSKSNRLIATVIVNA